MVAIMIKDIYQQRWLISGAVVLMFALSVLIPAGSVFALALYPLILLVVILVLVITLEGWEEKSKGYSFLSMLPISRAGVVAAKFINLLLITAVLSGVAAIAAAIQFGGTPMEALLSFILALSGGAALALGALLHSGMYVLGLARFIRISLIAVLGVQLVAVGLGIRQYNLDRGVNPLAGMTDFLLQIDPVWFVVIGAAIWLALLAVTACFRKRI